MTDAQEIGIWNLSQLTVRLGLIDTHVMALVESKRLFNLI